MVPRPPSSWRGRPAAFLLALAVLAAVVIPAAVAAAQRSSGAGPAPTPQSRGEVRDVRAALRTPGVRGLPRATKRERAARHDLVRRLGRMARLEVDPLTDTVRILQRLDGALSGPAASDPVDVARRYARNNAAALGLDEQDVDALAATRPVTTPSGITLVRFRQAANGIPAFDNELRIALDRGNRVLIVTGAPRHDLQVDDTTPDVGALDALRRFQDHLGDRRPVAVTQAPSGPRRATMFSTGDMARLVLFNARTVHLAWHLTYHAADGGLYDAVVDATTGEILRTADLVKHAVNVDVYPDRPSSAPGASQPVDIEPYLTGGTSATTLSGPNVRAFADLNDDDQPNAGEEVDPSPAPAFTASSASSSTTGCSTPILCSWDHATPGSWESNMAHGTVNAFWLANDFHDHLEAPPIGFTAARGAFEGDDALQLHAFDGATTAGLDPDADHRNNANMATPPDGMSPRMQMYLWSRADSSLFRDADASEDASIVLHEYTHGLSSRLVTWADGTEALDGRQSGAMGEGWSDWYAMDYLVNKGLVADDPSTAGQIGVGRYVATSLRAIRTEAIDCKVGSPASECPGPAPGFGTAGVGGYTYGDFGRISLSPEVHADGEIWAQTLWDLRDALGSATTEQLVTDAMDISPPEPTFLDMRNAILAADTGTTGGANHPEIWQTFATRGMGYFASSTDTMDAAPVENMNMPPQPTDPKGTVAGQITDGDTGQPLAGAAVGLSGHDSDPTFGEYLADTTDGTGHYIINNVPVGTYPKLAVHVAEPGWDIGEIQDVVIKDGAQTDVNVPLRFNWASLAAKGKVVSPIGDQDQYADLGCGADMAHDQARGTGWSSDVSADPAVAPALTIKLAQTIDVTRFAVDPSPICGDAATAAAAHVVIETSADGTTFAPAVDHTFGAGDVGHSSLLTPTGGTSGVRFVRIRLLSNQGSPYYVDLTEFAAYGNAIPRGTLAASPTSLQPGGTVNLDASSFVDPDGTVETYEWDFDGNGTVDDTTTAPNVSRVYPNAGTFQVRVAARDDRGGRGAATATVTVNPPPVITTPPPQPPGDTNPPVEEPPVVKQKARLSLSRHGKRGRTTFKVVCKDRCRVGATLTISNRLRRQIRNSVRTVGRIKARPILGTVKVTITLTKRARQHFRKYRVRRFKVVLRVTAAVVGGERTVRTKTVTLRV